MFNNFFCGFPYCNMFRFRTVLFKFSRKENKNIYFESWENKCIVQ